MSATRTEIDRSIEATKARLAQLSPAQIDQVLDQTKFDLEAFIRNEWLPIKPGERARRADAETVDAHRGVKSFGDWEAA